MDIQERDGKYIIVHDKKVIKETFPSEHVAWSWADRNIDDQVFDQPNFDSKPLEYEDDNS